MKITVQQIMNKAIDPSLLLSETQWACVEKIRNEAIEEYKQTHPNEADLDAKAQEAGDLAAAEKAARMINDDQDEPGPQPKQGNVKLWQAIAAISALVCFILIVLIGLYLIFSHSDNTPSVGKNQVTVSVPGTYTFQVDLPAMQNVEASANFTPNQTTFGSTTGQSTNNNVPVPQEQPNQSTQEPQLNF